MVCTRPNTTACGRPTWTLSRCHAEWAEKAVAEAVLAERPDPVPGLPRLPTSRSTRSAGSGCPSTWACRSFGRISVGSGGCSACGRLLSHGISRPTERRPHPLPAEQLHQPLRLPPRPAPRGRGPRLADPAERPGDPPPRELARALRAHASGVGRQPRGELGRGRGRGRAGAGRGRGVATIPGDRRELPVRVRPLLVDCAGRRALGLGDRRRLPLLIVPGFIVVHLPPLRDPRW
jgi:hypothetical protein